MIESTKAIDEILERQVAILTRAKSPQGLLSRGDLAMLFGFHPTGHVMKTVLANPRFPKPIYLGAREPRWRSGDVEEFIRRVYRDQVL